MFFFWLIQNEKGIIDYSDFLIASYIKKDLLSEKLELTFYDVYNSDLIEINDLNTILLHGKTFVNSNDTIIKIFNFKSNIIIKIKF